MSVCGRTLRGLTLISAIPESSLLQHLSDIYTACLLLCHINTAPTLSLQCKQAQYFDAVKPPSYLDSPSDNFSIGYSLLVEREHEAWVFMLTVPTALSEAPH